MKTKIFVLALTAMVVMAAGGRAEAAKDGGSLINLDPQTPETGWSEPEITSPTATPSGTNCSSNNDCYWCGSGCMPKSSERVCNALAPAEGYSCVCQSRSCTSVQSTPTPYVCRQCPNGAYGRLQGNANCNDSPTTNAIDLSDYLMWYQEFVGESTTLKADFNCSGKVDLSDYLVWYDGFVNYIKDTLPTPTFTETKDDSDDSSAGGSKEPTSTPVPMTGVTDPNVQP